MDFGDGLVPSESVRRRRPSQRRHPRPRSAPRGPAGHARAGRAGLPQHPPSPPSSAWLTPTPPAKRSTSSLRGPHSPAAPTTCESRPTHSANPVPACAAVTRPNRWSRTGTSRRGCSPPRRTSSKSWPSKPAKSPELLTWVSAPGCGELDATVLPALRQDWSPTSSVGLVSVLSGVLLAGTAIRAQHQPLAGHRAWAIVHQPAPRVGHQRTDLWGGHMASREALAYGWPRGSRRRQFARTPTCFADQSEALPVPAVRTTKQARRIEGRCRGLLQGEW
jgi:hypothetical protein